MTNLVIVESPHKATTIQKFLGKDYKVMSSYGHIRDLSKKDLGISEKGDSFSPVYEIPEDKKDLVKKLRAAAKEADTVWLASDEDREGEAIAWHLAEVLKLDPKTVKRIVFHEITKPAILEALKHPRNIDLDRVNAQQARRVLDRLVGFELSPVLWKKIKPALSAGRVQSVAVRLICEREKEIKDFKNEAYFRVSATFTAGGHDATPFKAEFSRRLSSSDEAQELLEFCKGKNFDVKEISVRPVKRSPFPPFTTSTLQQEANRRLGFSVNKTMLVAQKLYEGGFITYMRTDSLNLSEIALRDIAGVISSEYGQEMLQPRRYHTKSKGAQEAHEAIRPTYVGNRTISGTADEQKLYDLIWRRTMASQMSDAIVQKTTVEIAETKSAADTLMGSPFAADYFKAEGEIISKEGFLKVYNADSTEKDVRLPHMEMGTQLTAKEIVATERFTLAPARYTEAALVKKMEELGIGRPSTYAPTISTIQNREYVKRGDSEGVKREYRELRMDASGKVTQSLLSENTGSDKGKLVPTDIGMIVNDFLTEYFPDILDYNFTARVEEKFDEIAEGKLGWKDEITGFYGGFHPEIEKINSMRMEHKVGERILGTDPATGKPVTVKIGRFGPVVQIGDAADEEKPQFASLAAGQSIATLTLEEALKLFELPREVGVYEDKKVVAAIGRFGPYIRFNSMFVSIPKELTPQTITLPEAINLIEAKRKKVAESHIKEFPEMPGLQVLNGRFGPYLAYKPDGARKATNYKIPKGEDPHAMTLERAKELMEATSAATKKTTAEKPAAKKAAPKKAAAAKAPATKKTTSKATKK